MSSNANTPLLEPTTSQTLQPPSPSPLANRKLVDMDGIPPLSLDVLTSHADKVDALKLVTDSVAQQRQRAAFNLVFHPINLAALAAALAVVYQFSTKRDVGMALTLVSGVVMTYLLAIRWATSGYIRVAEELGWSWLLAEDGEEDTIIGTRFGRDLIGALVLRIEPGPAGKKRSRGNAAYRGGKGLIRAWTTKLRYRRRGVGADMLHEAVRLTREKCGRDAEVGFAKEHANSEMVLPEIYNAPFRRSEMHAAKTLDEVLASWEGSKRKR
jgi:hypothetical protein